MVSGASIIFMIFTLIVSVFFPVVLGIVLYRKSGFSFGALLVGIIVFLVAQVFLRIPGLQLLSQTEWYRGMAQNTVWLGLFLALTAGIFEEVGRWLGLRFLVKKQWQTQNGIAYGIGHGGIESIVLVGLTMVNNITISLMINSGTYDQVVSQQTGAEMAAVIKQRLIETPSYLFAVGGIERALTIIVHIGLSLLVLESLRRARPLYLLYAVLLHGLVNFPVVLVSRLPNAVLWSELWVLFCAVVSAVYIRKLWKERQVEPEAITA